MCFSVFIDHVPVKTQLTYVGGKWLDLDSEKKPGMTMPLLQFQVSRA
jgi:hypothetical protein